MKIINIKDINKGSVIKKFDLEFENFGLTIRDCILMLGKNGYFVSMPSKMYKHEGQNKYFNLVVWTKDKQNELNEKVVSHFEGLNQL